MPRGLLLSRSMRPTCFTRFFQEISMERAFRVSARILIFGVLSLFDLFLAAAGSNAEDKTIVSRTAEVDGVRLQYLAAGKGPAVILLHGYAETSRMWRPSFLCWRTDLR